MAQFRCKQCGRVYEELPASCFCGNTNPVLWDYVPVQAAPEPQDAGWQQPQAPAQQPYYGQNGYQPPAPPQNNGGGKSKKTALIAVIAAVALIGLAVGGYFIYQHFWGDGAPSSQSDDKDDNKKNDKKDSDGKNGNEQGSDKTPAPALSGTKLTVYGVTITVPDSYTLSTSNENFYMYTNADDTVRMMFGDVDTDTSGYATLTDFLTDEAGAEEGMEIRNVREYTVNGHRALSFRIIYTEGHTDGADFVMVEMGDMLVMARYFYDDPNNIPNEAEIRASLNSITVAD